MKPSRINKNGIPVYDEPKKGAGKIVPRCLPDKHYYRRVEVAGLPYDQERLECKYCPETITRTHIYDDEGPLVVED